ncbi:MAG: Crp/Fnr family transcriptional regulator [Planctomycetes bacterium]|nr:Crp/Fnr family transcriptional regulator [Planctomycetota bacterium]
MTEHLGTFRNQRLLDLPLFALLTRIEQDALLEDASVVTFDAGQTLLFKGDEFPGVFIVTAGEIVPESRASVKKAITHTTKLPGALIGVEALFGGVIAEYSLIARSNGSTIVVSKDTLLRVFAANSTFALAILKDTADELLASRQQVEALALQDAQSRLAKWLLERSQDKDGVIHMHYTQAEIAAHVGTVREVVSRAFTEFERRNLIRVLGRRLVVTRPNELQELAQIPAYSEDPLNV